MADVGITTSDVAKAQRELDRMKSALKRWMKYRTINDITQPGKLDAQRQLGDQRLAVQLSTLLKQVMPQAQLPLASYGNVVALAQIATGELVPPSASPISLNGWMWPAIIVGAVALTVTSAIKTNADAAADQEHFACIQSGACTDYGFWLKAASVVGLSWFAWTKLGVGDAVKGFVKKHS